MLTRYIIPDMTMDALKARVHAIVESDWRGKAEHLLEIRKATGKGDVSVVTEHLCSSLMMILLQLFEL